MGTVPGMLQFVIRLVSDEAMGERDWMVLLVRETGQVILAVKRSIKLVADEWAMAMQAVHAAYASARPVAA